jgi:hypothetical protein
VINDSTNPQFYQMVELIYLVHDHENFDTYPPFILDVYDKDDDLLDSTSDYLARAIIYPKDASMIGVLHKEDNGSKQIETPEIP